jgi:hypothetical protein
LQAELDELRGEKFSLEERLRLMEAEQAHRLVFTVSIEKFIVMDLDSNPFRTYGTLLLKPDSDTNPGFYENV